MDGEPTVPERYARDWKPRLIESIKTDTFHHEFMNLVLALNRDAFARGYEAGKRHQREHSKRKETTDGKR